MAQFLALDYDDTELRRTIDDISRRLGDLRPAMADIGEYMLLATRGRFDRQEAPDGTRWTPLQPSYAKRKRRQKSALAGILTLTGQLRDTITYEALPNAVVIGSNKIYAATHQLGRAEANIPARPYLGVSDADRAEITEILRGYLA
jgi:phage virion morphogenesis protein